MRWFGSLLPPPFFPLPPLAAIINIMLAVEQLQADSMQCTMRTTIKR